MKNFNTSFFFKAFVIIAIAVFSLQTKAQDVKICVIADIHYFDPDLLINDGTAFQTYLASDRKLLKESEAILESVIDTIKNIAPDVVIVAGDLTKDGEKSCHVKVAKYFDSLESAGIEVIVTPGNHDINNPHAFSYDGDAYAHVPSVTAEQFDSIYANHGFDQATAKDTASLSFVYNVSDSLTVISMDVCNYDTNYTHGSPVTAGRFNKNVLEWILDRVYEERNQGRIVMGVMHHGILEHYLGQETLFGEYVVNGWDSISTILADSGMNIVFTGHYHSQDIAAKSTDSSFIFDIETGATVTYPCPYRVITLDENNFITIAGDSIQNIDYDLDTNFQAYAKEYLEEGLETLVTYMLRYSYGLDSATAATLEPAITESFVAHYSGDEGTPSAGTQAIIQYMLTSSDIATYQMGYLMQQMWNDTTSDWDMTVQLHTKKRTTSINTGLVNSPVLLYPNPSTGEFTIQGEFDENTHLNIYNLSGKLVYTTDLKTNKQNIHTNLPIGIYAAEITDGTIYLKKKVIITK